VTGGIYNAGTVNVQNSLFANNTDLSGLPGDRIGTLNSLGYNFEAPRGTSRSQDGNRWRRVPLDALRTMAD
jgi:hypothetical protein